MGKKTISSDSNDRWNIGGSHGRWTLEADAELYVIDAPAVWVGKRATDNTVRILGDIVNVDTSPVHAAPAGGLHSRAIAPLGAIGVGVAGDHNTLVVGRDASITAAYGISGPAADTTVVNRGVISALVLGVGFDTSADISNFGTISAVLGVIGGLGSTILNGETGRIVGHDVGVVLSAGYNTLVNHGAIAGSSAAIYDDGGRSRIVNDGRLDGDVVLGRGNDRFDTRGGTVEGEVLGGQGDDIFYVSSRKIDLVEYAGEGYDTVKSTVSYKLGDNFESLVLLGRANIDGIGTGLADTIQGNAGNNLIKGLAGNDVLRGGAGTDRLVGGADSDIFQFVKGDQTDIIVDYVDGTDKIQILGTGFHSFNQLKPHIEEHGPDTWILLGGDDKIVLRDIVDMNVLDKTDFAFELR
jgi:Ca2+-binding RTX toxin-like protein